MDHNFCLFFKNDSLNFGWIREIKKNKLSILPLAGKEFTSPQSRIEYSWKAKSFSEAKEALAYLEGKTSWTKTKAQEIDLETIHELCDLETPYTIEELVTDFLEDCDDSWIEAALFVRLKNNPLLFKQKKDSFFARSAEEIATFREQELRIQEKKNRELNEQHWADLLLKRETPQISSLDQEQWDQFLHRMTQFIIYFEDSQERDYFETLFKCKRKEAIEIERLFLACLHCVGINFSWGKLLIQRSLLCIEETKEEICEIEILRSKIREVTSEEISSADLRSLPTFTVDNAKTKDFDDALSFVEKDEGGILYIHISDVASWIPLDSALFKRAEQNISTLYTLKGNYHMLPSDLSEDLFSLIEQKDRLAMTFEIEFNEDLQIQQSKIYASMIRVDENLSYTSVDQAITEEQGIWPKVWKICEALRTTRFENGALEVDREEAVLDISDPENIQITSIREKTPASLMIQELAVTANHIAATFCKNNELDALFRNQPPYKIAEHIEEGVMPQFKDVVFKPATINLAPEGHAALGLDGYLQVTSPIRRFSDLICQRIILQQLKSKKIAFDKEQLLLWAKRCEVTTKKLNQLDRTLTNHWKVKYIAQNREMIFEARHFRTLRNGKNLFIITPLHLIVEAFFDASPEQELIPVQIVDVNTDYDRVVVERVS